MSLTAATLFSGIGSPETAMPDWNWAWSAEIEKFPSAVLAARHSQSVNLGDVTADDFSKRAGAIARPDVLVFGSPCQSFSVAGKRLGLDDPRGNLALVALRIVGELEPAWFCFENVPGLLSSDEGRDFGLFLRTVDELGYSGAWASLDAQHFGVAQRRNRLFFVGHSGDWRYPAAVLFEPESLCGHSAPRRKTGKGVAPTIASHPTGGGGLRTDFDCDGGLLNAGSLGTRSAAHPSGMKHEADFMVSACLNGGGMGRIDAETETFLPVRRQGGDFDDVTLTLSAARGRASAHDPTLETYITHALRADGFDASEDGTGRSTPLVAHALDSFSAGRMTEDGTGRGGDKAHVLSSQVRRLTPRECERLQGFPDDYTLIEYRGKPAADRPRYKALGNSMAVPVMRWILQRIEQVTQLKELWR